MLGILLIDFVNNFNNRERYVIKSTILVYPRNQILPMVPLRELIRVMVHGS
ncbi:MAG: hypothetical protein ACTS73_03455 [Arsenophonus sp. NEOnobi-MAG3]